MITTTFCSVLMLPRFKTVRARTKVGETNHAALRIRSQALAALRCDCVARPMRSVHNAQRRRSAAQLHHTGGLSARRRRTGRSADHFWLPHGLAANPFAADSPVAW